MEAREMLYLGLYEKKDSEEVVAKMSLRPNSESTVLSVSLPPSVGRNHPNQLQSSDSESEPFIGSHLN